MVNRSGPFKIIDKVGGNAYKLQLPRDMAVSTTFNIRDLSPYVEDNFEDPSYLRTNPLQKGEIEVEQGTIESSQNPNQDQGTN